VQCFKSEVVNRLGTDQRGGGSSSAGAIDEWDLPRGANFTRLIASRVTSVRVLQTVQSLAS